MSALLANWKLLLVAVLLVLAAAFAVWSADHGLFTSALPDRVAEYLAGELAGVSGL